MSSDALKRVKLQLSNVETEVHMGRNSAIPLVDLAENTDDEKLARAAERVLNAFNEAYDAVESMKTMIPGFNEFRADWRRRMDASENEEALAADSTDEDEIIIEGQKEKKKRKRSIKGKKRNSKKSQNMLDEMTVSELKNFAKRDLGMSIPSVYRKKEEMLRFVKKTAAKGALKDLS